MVNFPKRSETHDQEKRSLAKLSSVLPQQLFLMRDEGRADGCSDYGVDRVLELRQETQYLVNLRAQIQMKSVGNASRNQDGSYSFPTPIMSLNYLRNQPNSIFVVYLENEDELVWEWVDAICQMAESEPNNIDLATTNQQTFSYRFIKLLDTNAFNGIHASVLHRGRVIRNVSEFISLTSSSEQTKAAVLLKNGNFQKIDETIANLKAGGIALTNAGGVAVVNTVLDNLPTSYLKSDPEVALIYTYVKFQLGLCYEALSRLPKGQIREKLSPNGKVLASYIELNMKFSLGMMSADDYVERLLDIEHNNPNSILSLQLKLERIRRSIPLNGSDGLKATIMEMNTTLNTLLTHTEADATIKLSAEITAWELEGWRFISEVSEQISTQRMRLRLGFLLSFEERKERACQLLAKNKKWMDKYAELKERTKDNPILSGHVYITASTIALRVIAQNRIEGNENQGTAAIIEVKSLVSSLYEQFTGGSLHHLALKARLLEADALEGLGEQQQAIEIANSIQQASQELGLLDIQQSADRFLSGDGIFSSAEKLRVELSGSRDDSLRKTSDESAKRMAHIFMESLELPETREENVLKDFYWMKKDAECRYSFCQHIQTLQNLTHGKSLATMYSIDPPRVISCEKYGFSSDIPGTDRNSLLALFVMNYCNKRKCNTPIFINSLHWN